MAVFPSIDTSAPARTAGPPLARYWVRVALDVPLAGLFDYASEQSVPVGMRVIVPFGRRKLVGVVVELPDTPALSADLIKDVDQVLDDLPALPADWLRLTAFAAGYYQRPLGEVMLPALPAGLRKVSAYQGKRSAGGPVCRQDRRAAPKLGLVASDQAPALNAEQDQAAAAIESLDGHKTVLLHGVTGSGKTEVYLRIAQTVLERGLQVLLLVPEINLAPQLEQWLRARLSSLAGPEALAVLHSGLSEDRKSTSLNSSH